MVPTSSKKQTAASAKRARLRICPDFLWKSGPTCPSPYFQEEPRLQAILTDRCFATSHYLWAYEAIHTGEKNCTSIFAMSRQHLSIGIHPFTPPLRFELRLPYGIKLLSRQPPYQIRTRRLSSPDRIRTCDLKIQSLAPACLRQLRDCKLAQRQRNPATESVEPHYCQMGVG